MKPRVRPVRRSRVLVAGIALLIVIAAMIGLAESLRHPPPIEPGVPEAQLPGSDPRDELVCPERLGAGPVTVTSNELFDCPSAFDGRLVRYRGEVVGALLPRAEGTWAQLNDDVYAELAGPLPGHRDYRGGNAGVGVLLPPDLAAAVSVIGGPQTRGDVFEIVGVFHRVDASGEVAVIRARDGQLVTAGGSLADRTLPDRRVAALIAAVIALSLVLAERRARAQR